MNHPRTLDLLNIKWHFKNQGCWTETPTIVAKGDQRSVMAGRKLSGPGRFQDVALARQIPLLVNLASTGQTAGRIQNGKDTSHTGMCSAAIANVELYFERGRHGRWGRRATHDFNVVFRGVLRRQHQETAEAKCDGGGNSAVAGCPRSRTIRCFGLKNRRRVVAARGRLRDGDDGGHRARALRFDDYFGGRELHPW